MVKEQKTTQWCNVIKQYAYVIWDGLVFFGHDDNKLERLRGTKPRWHDRFKNKRWLISKVSFGAVFIVIFNAQFKLLNTVKQQQIGI